MCSYFQTCNNGYLLSRNTLTSERRMVGHLGITVSSYFIFLVSLNSRVTMEQLFEKWGIAGRRIRDRRLGDNVQGSTTKVLPLSSLALFPDSFEKRRKEAPYLPGFLVPPPLLSVFSEVREIKWDKPQRK